MVMQWASKFAGRIGQALDNSVQRERDELMREHPMYPQTGADREMRHVLKVAYKQVGIRAGSGEVSREERSRLMKLDAALLNVLDRDDPDESTIFGVIEEIRDLVHSGANPNLIGVRGISAMHLAAFNNDVEGGLFLRHHGGLVEFPSHPLLIEQPMHQAAHQMHHEFIIFLHQQGASADPLDAFKRMPIQRVDPQIDREKATRQGRSTVIQLLIDHGSPPLVEMPFIVTEERSREIWRKVSEGITGTRPDEKDNRDPPKKSR